MEALEDRIQQSFQRREHCVAHSEHGRRDHSVHGDVAGACETRQAILSRLDYTSFHNRRHWKDDPVGNDTVSPSRGLC